MEVSFGPVLATAAGPTTRWRASVVWLCALGLWTALLVGGLFALYLHETTEGVQATAPLRYPSDSRLKRELTGATLIMFVHPRCPCTRASLAELTGLLSEQSARVAVRLVLQEAPSSDSPLAAFQRVHPEAQTVRDDDGSEARRFGAATSGHVVLYDARGALRFAGGITGSRGHVGDNAGRGQLRAALSASSAPSGRHAVFGCPLADLRDDAS